MKEVKITNKYGSYGNVESSALECPLCHGVNLHQKQVRTIWRDAEDGDGWMTTTQHDVLPETVRVISSEIEGRRDVLEIDFWCELCGGGVVTMVIVQHKGTTYIYWKPGWTSE